MVTLGTPPRTSPVVRGTRIGDLSVRGRALAGALAALLIAGGLAVAQNAGSPVPLTGRQHGPEDTAIVPPQDVGEPDASRADHPIDGHPLPGFDVDPLHPGAELVELTGQVKVLHWSGTSVTDVDVAAAPLWFGADGTWTITPDDEVTGCIYLRNGGPGSGRLTVALMIAAQDADGNALTGALPDGDDYWHAQHVEIFWTVGAAQCDADGDGTPDAAPAAALGVAQTPALTTMSRSLTSSATVAELLAWASDAGPSGQVVLAERAIGADEVVPLTIGFRMDCSVGSDAPAGVCEHGSDGIGEGVGALPLRVDAVFQVRGDIPLPLTGTDGSSTLRAGAYVLIAAGLLVTLWLAWDVTRRRRAERPTR